MHQNLNHKLNIVVQVREHVVFIKLFCVYIILIFRHGIQATAVLPHTSGTELKSKHHGNISVQK